jgi:heme-degrading monooxygenase HmoA
MIQFQLLFEVEPSKAQEFERCFFTVFQPALSRQAGFISVKLLRIFSPAVQAEIQSAKSEHNYQVNFFFESEQARRNWAKSPDHDVAWPKMAALTKQALWRGFDVVDAP